MKTKTKKNFKSLLLKLKKPLIILSFVFNILFILILIIGFCSPRKQNRTLSVSASDVGLNYKVHDLYNTTWVLNDEINTIPFGDQYNVLIYDMQLVEQDYGNAFLDIDFISNNIHCTTWIGYHKTDILNETIKYGFNFGSDNQNWFDVYRAGWVDVNYKTITITENNPILLMQNSVLIDWLYSNGTLISTPYEASFTFTKNFNYNAPYSVGIDSIFVTEYSEVAVIKTYDVGWFKSNNQYFNQVLLTYISGMGTRFIGQDNLVHINNSNGMFQYLYMQYKNSSTSEVVTVNYRNWVSRWDSSSGANQMCLTTGSSWVNAEYQKLYTENILTPTRSNALSQFNDTYLFNGVSESETDVGLTNVFVLMGSAFSSLTGIFAIELLPGISIGLLFFMPLIVGIILFVIWLVKR